MIAPGHREIACAVLIDPHGRFLLQLRDDVPNILYPGKIGLFGGHREGDETFLECVVREVHEETGYLAPPERFEHLGSYIGPEAASTAAYAFHLVQRQQRPNGRRFQRGE